MFKVKSEGHRGASTFGVAVFPAGSFADFRGFALKSHRAAAQIEVVAQQTLACLRVAGRKVASGGVAMTARSAAMPDAAAETPLRLDFGNVYTAAAGIDTDADYGEEGKGEEGHCIVDDAVAAEDAADAAAAAAAADTADAAAADTAGAADAVDAAADDDDDDEEEEEEEQIDDAEDAAAAGAAVGAADNADGAAAGN